MYQIINGWMVFDYWFNKPLSNIVFPKDIKKIQFGGFFDQDISNASTLPNSLTNLKLGYCFNQEMHNLSNSLTHLRFGVWFNQEIHNLPNSLTHLTFGDYFNQDVNNLPNSLIYLSFSWDFNQDISKLPKSITYLKFSTSDNSKFNHNLNPYLYHLTSFDIKNSHKHKRLMVERCKINQHNRGIREDKLIDLLLKN